MRIVVTGGTGSLGSELIRQLLTDKYAYCIYSISRTEGHLKNLPKSDRVIPILGDIRNKATFNQIRNADVIYHCAALKYVDFGERFVHEFVDVNVNGTQQVIDFANKHRATLKFSTTDKAVKPINAYGMSKGLAERLVLNDGHCVYRWGNVVGSNGSAIPMFIDKMLKSELIPLTHEDMTRYWIKIEDAAAFMIGTPAKAGQTVLPNPLRSASVLAVLLALKHILDLPYQYEVTGLRPGEKIHEDMDFDNHSGIAERYSHEELIKLLRPTVMRFL